MSEASESESRPDEKAWLWPIVSGGFAISAVALWLSSIFGNLARLLVQHWLALYLLVALFVAAPLLILAQYILARAVPASAHDLSDDLSELSRWRKAWLIFTLACLVSHIVLGLLFLVALPVDSAFAGKVFNALVGALVGSVLVTMLWGSALRLNEIMRGMRRR